MITPSVSVEVKNNRQTRDFPPRPLSFLYHSPPLTSNITKHFHALLVTVWSRIAFSSYRVPKTAYSRRAPTFPRHDLDPGSELPTLPKLLSTYIPANKIYLTDFRLRLRNQHCRTVVSPTTTSNPISWRSMSCILHKLRYTRIARCLGRMYRSLFQRLLGL